MFQGQKGGKVPRAQLLVESKKSLIYAFVLVEGIPIILPAFFLAISNIILIVKVDAKKKRDVTKIDVDQKYNPFSLNVREDAMKIASNLGKQ